jgi:hypothetical protein
MSLDDKLKNFAKYQFGFKRAERMRKMYLKALIMGVFAAGAFCIYHFGL